MNNVRLTKRGRILLVEVPLFLTCAGLGIFGGLLLVLWF